MAPSSLWMHFVFLCIFQEISGRREAPVSLRRLSDEEFTVTLGEPPIVPSQDRAFDVAARSPQIARIATGQGLWEDCSSITDLEKDVHKHLIQARASANIADADIPITRTVQAVSWYHATLLDTVPRIGNSSCDSYHSWDFPPPQGVQFTTCCYMSGNYNCMWDKTKEIGGNDSISFGVEISAWSSGGFENNDYYNGQTIVDLWLNSVPHRNVLLNVGSWSVYTWTGIGMAVKGQHANVWFIANMKDPNGECPKEDNSGDDERDHENDESVVDDDEGDGNDASLPQIGPCYAVVDELRLIHENPVAVIQEIPSSGSCRRIFSSICSIQTDNVSLCQAFTYDVAQQTCYLMPSASELEATAHWTSGYTTSCDPPPTYVPPGTA